MRFDKLLKIGIVAIALATAAVEARAQTEPSPEALQAAEELFALTARDMLTQIAEQVTNATWPQLGIKADAETSAALRAEFVAILMETMQDSAKDAPRIYATHLSASELRDIIEFYKSPTGQKTIQIMPLIMGEVMQSIIPQVQAAQMKTQERFTKILIERGYVK